MTCSGCRFEAPADFAFCPKAEPGWPQRGAPCALTNRCDEQGVGAAHAAIDLDRRLGRLNHLAVPLIVLGQIYQSHGEPARAIADYRKHSPLPRKPRSHSCSFPATMGLRPSSWIWVEGQAEEFMQRAQAISRAPGSSPTRSWCCRSWIGATRTQWKDNGSWRPCFFAPVIPPPNSCCRGQPRGPGLARRLSRRSPVLIAMSAASAPLLPAPTRPARHHAGQAQGGGRGDDGGRQYPAGARAALLQVSPRTRAAHRGPGGGDTPGVQAARGHPRREGIGSLVVPGEGHHGSAAGGTDQSYGELPTPQNPFEQWRP